MMGPESRRSAGILLIVLPTVIFGGVSILSLLLSPQSGYMNNPLRQNLWRAGHAHAGVFLILSLVALRYVDEAVLSNRAKSFVRWALPAAAILLPVAFFLSVLSPNATESNGLIYLAYAGALVLATGLITLGVGLIKKVRQ
jgi:drug/metabolite transporter superfamily protein YnfA